MPRQKAKTKRPRRSKAGYPIGGRPTAYKPEFAAQAKKLAAFGMVEHEIAAFLDVSLRTLLNWKTEHPLFLRALRVGKGAADRRVEQSLYHRAVGYSHEDTHVSVIEGEVVLTPLVKHYPPGEGAMKLWLTNRQPRKWREIKSTVISTPPGQPVEHRHTYGSTETLDEFYRRAHAAEQVSESAAAEGGADLGEGDEAGP